MANFTSDDRNTLAVLGQNTANGDAIFGTGTGTTGRGIVGTSDGASAVEGNSNSGAGIFGSSTHGRGVVGVSNEATAVEGNSKTGAGIWGLSEQGIGVYGKGAVAGFFEGDVEVTGDIRLANADCAEDFDVAGVAKVEPGTVMVLNSEGTLSASHQAYDKRVAGVISGAGHYQPGIILDKQPTAGNRQPVALMGKVFCKADAQFGPIEIGDLLTTSATPGHAMRAGEPLQAFGAVIGKALRPLAAGQGLIPILIALQ